VTLELLDWRRRVAAMYADVRAAADRAAAHSRWSEERTRLFATHPQSPDQDSTLRYAPYDARWRFETEVAPAPAEHIEIPTATDGVVPFDRIGRVRLANTALDLGLVDVWWLASYGGGVWLPLRDAHPDTYGGGRYVLDTVKGADLGGADGSLVVDLNFAYNPSCAYDEAWACPLAPLGNVIDVAVPAGELLPRRGRVL
jgi:uncharacterized protein (DUF1684 family)